MISLIQNIPIISYFFPPEAQQRDQRCTALFKKNVLTPHEREHRTRSPEHIQASLLKKARYAHEQMLRESDNPSFKFSSEQILLPSESGKVGPYFYGACHFIGRREEMEDESIACPILFESEGRKQEGQLFGLFDGHGGSLASRFAKEHLATTLKSQIETHGLTEEGIWNAFKMTFVSLSDALRSQGRRTGVLGTTATVALVLDGHLWIANVGDTRAILNANGTAIQLSEDMKPGTLNQPTHYTQRILNRGGVPFPGFPPRINGSLAVGGAIGDHDTPGVSARPAITRYSLADIPPGSHLILGCDGIFDVASTRQIARGVQQNCSLKCLDLARAIVASCYKAGSFDNLSSLVVRLK